MKKIVFLLVAIFLFSYSVPVNASKNAKPNYIMVYSAFDYYAGSFGRMSQAGITDFVIADLDYYDYNLRKYNEILAPRTVHTILSILREVPNASIWLGTPSMSSNTHPYHFMTGVDKIYSYIITVKNILGPVWDSNVKGIYMNSESVYYRVNYNNLYENPSIFLMNALSFRIRNNLELKFLWIPYYGLEHNVAENIKNIGYVINTTNIFDYVLLQPSYYFSLSLRGNLDGVFYSVLNQEIRYRNNVPVIKRTSNATAEIGFLMEIDGKVNWFKDRGYEKRYNMYTFNFIGLRNLFPSGFYTSGPGHIQYDRIKYFYGNQKEEIFGKNIWTKVIYDFT